MRRVRYVVAMSLDGYIAGPNGEADWIIMDPEIDFHEPDPAEVLLGAAREGERPTLVAVGSVSTRVIRAGPGAVLVYPPAGEH